MSKLRRQPMALQETMETMSAVQHTVAGQSAPFHPPHHRQPRARVEHEAVAERSRERDSDRGCLEYRGAHLAGALLVHVNHHQLVGLVSARSVNAVTGAVAVLEKQLVRLASNEIERHHLFDIPLHPLGTGGDGRGGDRHVDVPLLDPLR